MQDVERSPNGGALDLMVWRAARARRVQLVAAEVDEICEAVIRGVWDAVGALHAARLEVIEAQFAGITQQIANERRTEIARRWWGGCEQRATELRARLPELRARDARADTLAP